MDIKCHDDKRGSNYWKCNESNIKDKQLCDGIKQSFDSSLEMAESNKLSKPVICKLVSIKVKEFSNRN